MKDRKSDKGVCDRVRLFALILNLISGEIRFFCCFCLYYRGKPEGMSEKG